MPEKYNPALRVYRMLNRAYTKPANHNKVFHAWGVAFGVAADGTEPTVVQVAETQRIMNLFINEILLAKRQMDDARVLDEDLYKPAFDSALSVLTDIAIMPGDWGNAKTAVGPSVLNEFRRCSQLTPVVEEEVDEDSLEDLKEELREFRTYANGNLPDGRLRDFVLQQINIMGTAIQDYEIIGPKAFGEGRVRLYSDAAENLDLIEEEADQETVGKWRQVVTRFATIAARFTVSAAQVINAANTIRGELPPGS